MFILTNNSLVHLPDLGLSSKFNTFDYIHGVHFESDTDTFWTIRVRVRQYEE